MASYYLANAHQCERFKSHVSLLIERRAHVVLTEIHNNRSLKQNALLHSWLSEIASHTGMAPEDVKREIKHIYRRDEYVSPLTGEVEYRTWHTSHLDQREMNDFLAWLRVWALDVLGLVLSE